MSWLHRMGLAPAEAEPESGEPVPEPAEGAAPGVAALLGGVSEDRSHAVLDLGAASDQSLRIYGRYARRVRFADLAGDGGWPRRTGSVATLLKEVAGHPEQPYDLVFGWDVLDRLFPEDRPRLVAGLAELTAPEARLHVVTREEDAHPRPLHFTLLELDRIRYEPLATGRLPRPRLLPAEVATLLAPFHVVRGFTLRNGMREYVAVRQEE